MVPGVRPSGTVTFLFTDIEASTRRWETDADSMSEALAAHDEVLVPVIDGAGGWVFKHTGDGVCAAFDSPGAAVNAAIDAQRRLGLPVRMGIATGEAEVRGDDYFGLVLSRVARVMDAGHGGQVLVAAETAGLVDGVELVDLGARRLRGLSEPVGLFQVLAEGLRAEFPPLRTLDETAGNLRPQAGSFVGREDELMEVIDAVGAHRLVTLTGVGGVGKTRLAMQVAAELAPEFPDGIFVVELGEVDDPVAVPDVVAGVLGVSQQPGMTVTDSVVAAQAGRERMLVFDNCEHLLDATAEFVEAIFDGAETVRMLATSREGLRVGDEHVWTVPSLETRSGAESQAVALFVERARASVKDFSLEDARDRDAVVETCRRLDGIPLAIELAASRIVSMSPADVRDRLDDRFRLLSGSRRGLERHQTLRRAVQWSYDLLDADEQQLLTRCAVFVGGFDADAAVAISAAGDPDEYAVLDRLDSLVRKSLLVVDRATGRARYSMLETIRQFAEERLADAGEAVAVRTLHAEHYAEQIAAVWRLWDGPRQATTYAWLERELANLRRAFRFAADEEMTDVAVAITVDASQLGWALEFFESYRWAEEILPAARAVDHPHLAALYATAAQCLVAGREDDALAYCDAGLTAIAGADYGDTTLAIALIALLNTYPQLGRFDEWVAGLRTGIDDGADTWGVLGRSLAVALALSGRHDDAVAAIDGLIDQAEQTDNPWVVCGALLSAGWVVQDADPQAALAMARRGLDIARDSGNQLQETNIANVLATLEAEHGDTRTAVRHFRFVMHRQLDAGNVRGLRAAMVPLAVVLSGLGLHEAAATLTGQGEPNLVAASTALPGIEQAIIRTRTALGDEEYERHAAIGAAMSPAAAARYADQQVALAEAGLAP